MIIWLASYPRSGNTLLRIILNAAFGRRSHSKHNDTRDIGADARTADAVGHAPLDLPWGQAYPAMRDSADPFFVKTHDAPEDDAKAIYVVRDGRSSCVSFHHYLNDFGDGSLHPTLADVILGFTPFGSWGSHLDEWDPVHRPDTLLLKYEDLVNDPGRAIHRIAQFTGLTPVRTWENNFDELHRINPKFFRAGATATAAAAELSPADDELFWHHHADWMRDLGYVTPVPVTRDLKSLRAVLSARGRRYCDAVARDAALQADLADARSQAAAAEQRVADAQSHIDAQRASISFLRGCVTDALATAADLAQSVEDVVRRATAVETRYDQARAALGSAVNRLTRTESYLDPFLHSKVYRTFWKLGVTERPRWVDAQLTRKSSQDEYPIPPALSEADALHERCAAITRMRDTIVQKLTPPPPDPRDSESEMDAFLRHLVDKGFRPRAVLDVGSAKGYWSERTQWLYFPDADYYMIDPLDESQDHLRELAGRSPQFRPLQLAIGSQPGELAMNVTPDGDSSSLLTFSTDSAATRRTVPIETLDRLLDSGRIAPADLVKVDVQGFEIEVLRGAAKLLGQADVFIIEVNLFPFMPGCPLAHEVVCFMADRGYRLYDLAGALRRPHQDDLGQLDLVFVRNDSPLVSSNRWK